jgi:hypothetical protein
MADPANAGYVGHQYTSRKVLCCDMLLSALSALVWDGNLCCLLYHWSPLNGIFINTGITPPQRDALDCYSVIQQQLHSSERTCFARFLALSTYIMSMMGYMAGNIRSGSLAQTLPTPTHLSMI